MKKCFLVAVLILSVSFIFLPSLSFGEEALEPQASDQPEVTPAEGAAMPQTEGLTEFSYGTVKSVSENQLVVTEYDYDNDKDIDVTYSVPPDATLDGVAKLTDIVVGDAVDIDYVVKDGEKVASVISVEKGMEETEGEEAALSVEEEEAGEQ